MRRRLAPFLARLAFLGLLIAALAGAGARPVPSEMDLRLDAWAAAGMAANDLCGDHGAGHKDGHCPWCSLADPPGLPSLSAFLRDAEQRILARRVLPRLRRAVGHARDPALPKRGPPVPT